MKAIRLKIPEKIFGLDTTLISVWLGPVLVLTTLIFTFVGVINPRISEIVTINRQIREVKKATLEVINKKNYFLSVDSEELNSNAALLNSGIMPEKNSYLLVKIISGVARNSGFVVSDFSVSLGDVKKQEQIKESISFEKIPVQLVLSGPRDKYLELIGALEKNLPVLSIDSFNMKGSGEIASIEMGISAYFQPESVKVQIETLGIKEMTLTNEETTLLSTIKEFKVFEITDSNGAANQFKQYQRSDPFFTP